MFYTDCLRIIHKRYSLADELYEDPLKPPAIIPSDVFRSSTLLSSTGMAASVKRFTCDGMDQLLQLIEEHSSAGARLFVLCSGSVDPNTGVSWCPDCVTAEPVIEKAMSVLSADDVFIACAVGDLKTWRDPQCPFRTHPQFQLKGVPTLMEWGTSKRLGDKDCADADMVEMLFEEE